MTSEARSFRPEALSALAAVQRGLELVQTQGDHPDVVAKGTDDVVTSTDFAVEDVVRELIMRELGHAVIGEERGGEPAAGAPYWLLDPICGTRNFASQIPLWCINLALVEDDEVTVAVVGDPSIGGVVLAERGAGAWVFKSGDHRRLASTDASRTIVIEDSHAEGNRREQAAEFLAAAVRLHRWELRSLSTTLSLAYVAAGRIAAYVLFWTSAIHAAAGSLVAREAGSIVTDIHGRPWSLHSDSIVASATAALHRELLDLIGRRADDSSNAHHRG